MINLMVGSNYDPELHDGLIALNEKHNDIKVSEIYGSSKQFKVFGSARPDFRLPNISMDNMEQEIAKLVNNGILVNYTENTPLLNKVTMDVDLIKDKLRYLERIGVSRITIAHPLAMEMVSRYCNIGIEVSTIYEVKHPYQVRMLKDRAPSINKICVDVDSNRNYRDLWKLKDEADKHGIVLELLANEFCIHDCIDRVQCYLDHAQVSTDVEAAMFSRYPMGRCTVQRHDPLEWLRARFILPQHLDWYKEFAFINHFKITGRTHPTRYILWVTETYMKKRHGGNLLELWADVKNIKRVSQGKDHLAPNIFIDSSKLDAEFLAYYWGDTKFEEEFLKQYL